MPTNKQTNQDPYEAILKNLLSELVELRAGIEAHANQRLQKYQTSYHDGLFSKSARNLAHYLAMRQHDLRDLQDRLAQAGLSSLGRSESSVLSTFDALIDVLQRATDKRYSPTGKNPSENGFNRGHQLLEQHTIALFGSFHDHSKAHVMVTLGTEASWDYKLISALMQKGMTCARVNCAHDDPEIWQGMIRNIRRAETELGSPCRVLMDLAGHKIRTGLITLGPPVRHIKVKKDQAGKIISPGYAILCTEEQMSSDSAALFRVPISKSLHNQLSPNVKLGFIDHRNRQRFLRVEQALSDSEWLVSCEQSAYLRSGCEVKLLREDEKDHKSGKHFKLGEFAGQPLEIRVCKGDTFLLTPEHILGKPAEYDEHGKLQHPAQIGCTLSSAIDKLKVGQPVWIDDGKLGAMVESISKKGALLRITQAKASGVKIGCDKGINFPETDLNLSPLSQKDLTDLDFACTHADLVGFSFVESQQDMEFLMAELAKRNASELPIVAKIETNRAVKNLPDIILVLLAVTLSVL